MALVNEPNEILYRKIHSKQFDECSKEISPVAFIDRRGCSVNKLSGRNEKDIISYYESKWETPYKMKAIVNITVQECLDISIYPIDDNSNKPNPHFHAEIHDSACKIEISKIKARLLAKKVKIVKTY